MRAIFVFAAGALLACGPASPPPAELGPPPTATPREAAVPVPGGEDPPAPQPADEGTTVGDANPLPTGSNAFPEPPPEPAPPPKPPRVKVSEPSFIGGGEVPKVASFLERMAPKAADCIAEHDPAARGKMKIQFLVSLRARAEGVDVMKADDFNESAQHCVRDALKGGRVQTPTADPTGVQFTYTFE